MFSKRSDSIKQFIVMEILEKALSMEEEGADIIHLEIGEPDFDTPQKIIEGTYSKIKEGFTHYTHSLGILELRKALSDYKLKTRGTFFDPKTQFMVTGGTSPAFFNVISALINPGDEVIITDPAYPCYENFINFFGGKPIFVPIYEENEFDLDISELKKAISPKTKAIILNSPSNPTGLIIRDETLEKIADLVIEKDIWVISDEIYAELTYDGKIAPSLSEETYKKCHKRLIILDGFSKYWAMTGWRLGYIIAPPLLIERMLPIQQNFNICAPSVSQVAALYALECEKETKEMLSIYKKRREFIVNRINYIKGISCLMPKGAFYVFANIKDLNILSRDFALKLLEEVQVAICPAICPGIAFGPNGEGYVRFSYANNLENIKEGMKRVESFIKENFS
ncbi:MAG: pyridoxal phosphate-dependent aminotransferase [Promethearchaeota archaeon]